MNRSTRVKAITEAKSMLKSGGSADEAIAHLQEQGFAWKQARKAVNDMSKMLLTTGQIKK